MKPTPTIVLTGGGSGGHITPLLPLAQELKRSQPGIKLVYIGHKADRVDVNHDPKAGFDKVYKINGGKFRRYHGETIVSHLLDLKTLLLNGRDFFRVVVAFFVSIRLLSKLKPAAVFSKGGFVVVPVCLAAKLKGIPIITHDSDAIPGLANRIIGRWATVYTTGMPKNFYNYPADRTFFVGIPMPQEVKKINDSQLVTYKKKLGIPKTDLVVLVTGGGNGSAKLNDFILASAPKLLSDFPALHIFHVTGAKHYENVIDGYKSSLSEQQFSRVRVFSFVDKLYALSGASDLIITRAGASSIAEFGVQAKACIVIPSPFLAAGHQLKNAARLKEQNAALILDNTASDVEFEDSVSRLLKNPAKRAIIAANLNSLAKADASKRLAKIILSVAIGETPNDAG